MNGSNGPLVFNTRADWVVIDGVDGEVRLITFGLPSCPPEQRDNGLGT